MLPSALRVALYLGQMLPTYVLKTTVSSNVPVRLVGFGQVKTPDAVSFQKFRKHMFEGQRKLCSSILKGTKMMKTPSMVYSRKCAI